MHGVELDVMYLANRNVHCDIPNMLNPDVHHMHGVYHRYIRARPEPKLISSFASLRSLSGAVRCECQASVVGDITIAG